MLAAIQFRTFCLVYSLKNVKIRIYRTIILAVGSYGSETWSLTSRGKHILRMFEKRLLRSTYRPKRVKKQEVGENLIMRSFITSTTRQIQLE
jgi:hypothetical protein